MTNPAPARRARGHAPPEARRAQILEAALRCFGSKGYHAATMDDLARAAGLSKGSLYWHFRSKQEVFLALFDAFADEVFRAWDGALSEEEDTLVLFRRYAEIVLERLGSYRYLLLSWAEFLSHPEARERMAAIYATSRAKLGELVERGVRRGELRDLPCEAVAATLTAALEGMLLQAMVDPEFDVGAQLPTLWEVVQGGLAR